MKAAISIIVAHDDKLGIGKNNQLPWHISADLKKFKNLTTNHPIIMGRKTFKSIGKPLPNRTNIIITRNKNYTPGCNNRESDTLGCHSHVVHSLKAAIKLAKQKDNQEIFIIGGGEIYNQALPLADKLYITHIKGNFNCDTFFSKYSGFKLQSQKDLKEGKHHFSYLTLIK